MKYIVMECHIGYAVVLDEDGRFLKVANRNYRVGQMIADVIEMSETADTVTDVAEMDEVRPKARTRRKARSWMYSVAAMAACLVLVMVSVFTMDQKTYASVFLSINPRVRVDVNKKDVVVGLAGVNEDGKDLIDGYDYKKKKLDVVMDELVDLAVEKGYLIDGGTISLSFDSDDDDWIKEHKGSLCSELAGHLEKTHHMNVGVSDQCDTEHEEGSHSGADSNTGSNSSHTSGESSTSHENRNDEKDDDDDDNHESKDKSDSVKPGKVGDSSSSHHESHDKDEDHDDDHDDDDNDDDDDDDDDDHDDHDDDDHDDHDDDDDDDHDD